jgi:hypothetical protein
VRIVLATPLGGDIDGAWWPHTGSVAAELPGLIEALHKPLGEIVDMRINWSANEGPPDLNSMGYTSSMPGSRGKRQRLMVVSGRNGCAKLLVIPHMTAPALGLMLLRRAAAMHIPDGQQTTQVFLTADSVVRAAQVESASWATQAAERSRSRKRLREV